MRTCNWNVCWAFSRACCIFWSAVSSSSGTGSVIQHSILALHLISKNILISSWDKKCYKNKMQHLNMQWIMCFQDFIHQNFITQNRSDIKNWDYRYQIDTSNRSRVSIRGRPRKIFLVSSLINMNSLVVVFICLHARRKQWCSHRDHDLGLEAPQGQKWVLVFNIWS